MEKNVKEEDMPAKNANPEALQMEKNAKREIAIPENVKEVGQQDINNTINSSFYFSSSNREIVSPV